MYAGEKLIESKDEGFDILLITPSLLADLS